MALTRQDLERGKALAELADVFGSGPNAQMLLSDIGIPLSRQPSPALQALVYWNEVFQLIDHGIIDAPDPYRRLLLAALEMFRGNRVFRQVLEQEENRVGDPVTEQPGGGAAISVVSWRNLETLIEAAQAVAERTQPPLTVRPGFVSAGVALFHLPAADLLQASRFADALTQEMARRGQTVRVSAATADFRDYLITPLFVEGPDQARFELTNVPASTTVENIARGVMNQYDPKVWGKDPSGNLRPSTVDHLKADGTAQRLNPDATLHDSGVGDRATLHVAPQSTAGAAVHPQVREDALARVLAQVKDYAQRHPGFVVQANAPQAPTEYVFRFRAAGWAPPAAPGERPIRQDEHEVFLAIPADFPMVAPQAFWQTPIYHPNVHRETGLVCLGALGDRYRPGMDFGKLCQMLVDMAAYRNYTVAEFYDREARDWALSLEGQAAIEQRGGQSLFRQISHELGPVRPLEIKRVTE